EFAYGLDAVRNDVIQDTAQEGSSLGGDFWASDAPDSPTAAAVERAIKIVQERYAVYDIATEAGIIDSPSWDAIEERVGSGNADREDAMNTGGVVTGLQNFDLSTYVDAEARYIRDSYIANDDNPGMTPNDAQIQSYYDAHEWTISDDGAPAALEDVRSNVIQEYKQTYFEREVERRIQAQDVHTDLAELRSFASEYLSARGEK
ncbi:MAG: hypothetical protein SPI14_00005, partial [Arcanobacterium sp.]|nr:hypothetical protein [Arcanobacterium sp.]